DLIMSLGPRATCVLGNHDLHVLGVAAGIRTLGKRDTAHDILDSPHADRYIGWLRQQRLAHYSTGHLMVHAGVLPAWSLHETLALANEVEQALQAPDWPQNLRSEEHTSELQSRFDLVCR